MSDAKRIIVWICIICAILLSMCAGISSLTPTKVKVNTLADEPKIIELVNARLGDSILYHDSREKARLAIINEYYTIEKNQGFEQTYVKVLFAIAGIPASIALCVLFAHFYSCLNLGTYFAEKAKAQTAKMEHYKKTLDELIRIQEKISKTND